MTANEAREIIINDMKGWTPFPGEDTEYGEVEGPVSEDEYSFYFEIPEYDRISGKSNRERYEVNKETRQVGRVVYEG